MNKHSFPQIVPLLALSVTVLACIGATTIGGATPTASFSTATPGGSISISLLTPTITVPGAPNQGVLIGSVATATAEAQAIAGETATARALIPTPTVAGIFAAPAVCPAPGTPTLPEQSPPFTQYAELIAQYLSAGGATTVMESRLRGWGALTDYGGLVIVDRDFTGDSVSSAGDGVRSTKQNVTPQPATCSSSAVTTAFTACCSRRAIPVSQGAPVLHSADDLNGIFSAIWCTPSRPASRLTAWSRCALQMESALGTESR
jgi:hypothetical protein